MAGVTSGATHGKLPSGDRGQLILVTAFSMVILLVVFALVLNTSIYTQNLSTRDIDTSGTHDALQFRHDVEEGLRPVIEYANAYNNTSYGALNDTIETGIADWSNLVSRHDAVDGRASRVSIEEKELGVRIQQTNESRTLTSAGGDGTWTLLSDVNRIREYRLTLSRASLADADENDSSAASLVSEGAFTIVVDGASDSWRVFVYQDGSSDVLVKVEDASGSLSNACEQAAGSDGAVTVSLTNATLDSEDCPSLDFLDEVESGYEITYRRGTNATGTYSLVTDRRIDHIDTSNYGANPSVTEAVYGVRVGLTYRSPTLDYTTELRVVPGDENA